MKETEFEAYIPPSAYRKNTNEWIAERVERLNDAAFCEFLKDPAAARAQLAPAGMPNDTPRESATYKRWKAWAAFLDVCTARSVLAAGAASRYFEKTGTPDASRRSQQLVFLYELSNVR